MQSEFFKNISVNESVNYGVFLTIFDSELADEIEDFLNEKFFVFFNIKFNDSQVEFYFGQAACVDKVSKLLKEFARC